MINFQDGEILLVDKPLRWTSFDVVNKIRWQLKQGLGIKKIKVGHAGTLDPLATGLLIVCTGKATKKIETLTQDSKIYQGTFLLGKTTPCYDLEQDFDRQDYPIQHIDHAMLQRVATSFIGEQLQYPPIFSAKQIDGQRAYDIARSGKTLNIQPNSINIHQFTMSDERFPEIDFTIHCSKGTYIRSIAHDLGKRLNSGATLVALRRITSGTFHIKDAKNIEETIKWIQNNCEQARDEQTT